MPHHSMSSESKVLVGGFTQVTKQQGLLVSYQSGALAQLVEQLTFNQLVDGSNPSCPTILYILKNGWNRRIYVSLIKLSA